MAITHLTSAGKMHVYRALARINTAFRTLHFHLRYLEQTRSLRSQRLREYQGFSRELQSQINTELLESLAALEREDAFHFGRVRSARAKYLKR